mgnify:CR=1 FL=1
MYSYQVKTKLGHVNTGVTVEMVENGLLDAIIERNDPLTVRFDEIRSAIIKLDSDDDLESVYTDTGLTVSKEDV